MVFVNKQVDVSDFFPYFFCFVFGYIFSKLSQIPCFSRRVILMLFGVSCEVFIWKASKHEGFCMVDVSNVKQQEAATRASQSNRQRMRSNATKETEDTSRIRMDVILHPTPIPHHPRTELKDKCKFKLACAKSRESAKTPKKCDRHRKQQKKQKTQAAFAWTSSPPNRPPPPHRAERQMQV